MKQYKHYSIRYTEVMAVDSDFVLAEKDDYKNLAARRWKAFREQIDQSRAATADTDNKGEYETKGGAELSGLPDLHIIQSEVRVE